jgi:methionyl-tRNA formyltransferase
LCAALWHTLRAFLDGILMKITLAGSRWFGAEAFRLLQPFDIDIARVVVPAADDRLAIVARGAGADVYVLPDHTIVDADAIVPGTDLIVSAHNHARVSAGALSRSRLGGVGYHPSLLPRHRGIAAIEWTVKCNDAVAGGTIYHLAERMDAGAIAAQDWCFVKPGETARELWERALAPLGLRLLVDVVEHARAHGSLPSEPQDEQFATQAPRVGK